MKRLLTMALATGLAAAWVGCQSASESEVTVDADTTSVSGDEILVKLKVPNMT